VPSGGSHTEASQEWHVDQSHQRQVQLRFPGKGDQHRRVKKNQLRRHRGSSRRRGEAWRLNWDSRQAAAANATGRGWCGRTVIAINTPAMSIPDDAT
jgi:hypothetical protein